MAGVAGGAVVSAARDQSQQELINATAQTALTRRDIDSLILLIALLLRASNWYSLGSEPLNGSRRRIWQMSSPAFRRRLPQCGGPCGPLHDSGICSAGKVFICNLPRVALGRSFLADPMEAVGSDLSETPSSFQTARVIADLDNVLTLGAPDLARIILVERVSPDDVPATDPDRRCAE